METTAYVFGSSGRMALEVRARRFVDAASLEDYSVDVSGTTVSEAAMEVAGLAGWMR